MERDDESKNRSTQFLARELTHNSHESTHNSHESTHQVELTHDCHESTHRWLLRFLLFLSSRLITVMSRLIEGFLVRLGFCSHEFLLVLGLVIYQIAIHVCTPI